MNATPAMNPTDMIPPGLDQPIRRGGDAFFPVGLCRPKRAAQDSQKRLLAGLGLQHTGQLTVPSGRGCPPIAQPHAGQNLGISGGSVSPQLGQTAAGSSPADPCGA